MESAATQLSSRPLGFLEKVRLSAACAVAVLLLWSIGGRLAAPSDPQMAVTLAATWGRVLGVWPTVLVLSVIAAAVGTVIMGRRLPEAGVLAASIGLTALSLSGGSMQVLLAYRGTAEIAGRRSLMMLMWFDALLWTVVLGACWVIVVLVRRWLWEPQAAPAAAPAPASKAQAASAKPRAGWPALVVCTVVAVLVVWSTISRSPVANIARGQVIASVFGGLFLGALAARYFTGITDVRWYALAPPLAALIGYLLGYLSADMGWAQGTIYQPYAFLATTPPHDLVRALPVEYIAVGIAGTLFGFWWAGHLVDEAQQEPA